MQVNFQQPMSARTMRVCTICSERWDTAEDSAGDYMWVVCCKKKGTYIQRTPPPMEKKKRKKRKRCRVPSIELANFDWIV